MSPRGCRRRCQRLSCVHHPLQRRQVVDCGFQDQVFTIYDVLHGDFSSDTEIYEMDEGLLTDALEILEEREPQKAARFDDDEVCTFCYFCPVLCCSCVSARLA